MAQMRKKQNMTELQFDDYVAALRKQIADSVSPFENDTPEKQAQRIEACRNDDILFMRTYLPHYFPVEEAPCHREWCEVADTPGLNLIGAPRDHAKTTVVTFGKRVKRLCYVERHYIMLGSNIHEQAKRFTVSIKVELEDNPRLKHDFGAATGKTRTWSDDCFVTKGGTMVEALGRGDQWRGKKFGPYRPDDIGLDDLEDNATVKSPAITQAIIEFIQGEVLGCMEGDCSATMVGNLFHGKSAISQLIAMEDEDTGLPLYNSRVYDAIVDEELKITLWPARWPWEKLMRKKRLVTTRIFNKEFRNKTTDTDSPFPEETATYYERILVINRRLIFATGIDPSATSTSKSDFRAVVTWGLDVEAMVFHCMHAWIKRRSISEMFGAAYAQYDQYPGRCPIEENMLKEFLHEAIQNYARKVGSYLPWAPIHHSTNKVDGRIIGTCEYLWEHKKMQFEKRHSDQKLLVEQFVYINNNTVHDDGPDASEMAINFLQKGSGIRVTDCMPEFTEAAA
jgi:predicted phage terminase large subunit-like protein